MPQPRVFAETNILRCNANSQWAHSLKVARTPTKAFPCSTGCTAYKMPCFSASNLTFSVYKHIHHFKENRHVLVPPHVVVVYRGKPLITGYVHPSTSCCPPRALPVVSWPSLIKRLRPLGQLAPICFSRTPGRYCSGSTNRVNTAISDVEVFIYQSKMLLVKTRCVWHVSVFSRLMHLWAVKHTFNYR